ncbi:MAG: ThiF family adenylyltransferase [Candidatus Heimdallarchaeota archaeon]
MEEKVKLAYYEDDRHDRTSRFFGKETFQKLRNKKILVIGAGAIGNEVIKNLVLLGVKEIKVVDFDIVSKSNANRCIFFRESDHNKYSKVEAVKKRVNELSNGVTKILPYECRIEETSEEVWKDLDLIIIGVDNDYTRMLINAKVLTYALEKRFIPVINGAMALTFVECEVLLPGLTACLTCLWTNEYKEQIINKVVRENCDEFFIEVLPKFPAISTFTSVVGGLMVTEATKLLTLPDTKELKNMIGIGYLIRHDLKTYEYNKGAIMRNSKCTEPFCRSTYNDDEYKILLKNFWKLE